MIPYTNKPDEDIRRLRESGSKDWHHDPDGKVNYTWSGNTHLLDESEEIDWKARHTENDASYRDECSEEAYDNLAAERYRHAARCEAFKMMDAREGYWD